MVNTSTWVLLVCGALGSSACKTATPLSAGGFRNAGPILIHDPMGIGRVRFASRETGVGFEFRESLIEAAGGGTSSTTSNGTTTVTSTVAYGRVPSVTRAGFKEIGPRTWAANVHVDTSRWFFLPLLFVVSRAYVEAQGEVVDVAVRQ
jgi:hypothetical protein